MIEENISNPEPSEISPQKQEDNTTEQQTNPKATPSSTAGTYVHGQKPKKPMSAYFHFMIEKSKTDKLTKKEVAELWGTLDTGMKQKYVTMAEEEKARYLEWMRYEEKLNKEKANNKLETIPEENQEGKVSLDKDDDGEEQNDKDANLIPGHRVKNILKSDEDASKNLRANTLKYYTLGAELFAKF